MLHLVLSLVSGWFDCGSLDKCHLHSKFKCCWCPTNHIHFSLGPPALHIGALSTNKPAGVHKHNCQMYVHTQTQSWTQTHTHTHMCAHTDGTKESHTDLAFNFSGGMSWKHLTVSVSKGFASSAAWKNASVSRI